MISCGDEWGFEAMKLAKQAGIRVPEDYSVIGFDSTSLCKFQNPPLTAIYQPLSAMGELAVDLLVGLIEGRQPDPIESVMPCRLDVRESTARAR